uniref:Uncharacterized protein n=1 Tax=Rhizophora mucronata TaxID=61149 RepID=A0A2P2PQI2_RHIMU
MSKRPVTSITKSRKTNQNLMHPKKQKRTSGSKPVWEQHSKQKSTNSQSIIFVQAIPSMMGVINFFQ